MYGLIGRMLSKPGQREALIAAMTSSGSATLPGCLSYVVARDSANADGLWITEVWENEAAHQASLNLPEVQAAIAKARPLIAGFDNRVVTDPVSVL
jgi:quinol monooxygenase YgiN